MPDKTNQKNDNDRKIRNVRQMFIVIYFKQLGLHVFITKKIVYL